MLSFSYCTKKNSSSYADCFYHTKISFDSSPQHLLFLLQEADVARSPKPSAKVSLWDTSQLTLRFHLLYSYRGKSNGYLYDLSTTVMLFYPSTRTYPQKLWLGCLFHGATSTQSTAFDEGWSSITSVTSNRKLLSTLATCRFSTWRIFSQRNVPIAVWHSKRVGLPWTCQMARKEHKTGGRTKRSLRDNVSWSMGIPLKRIWLILPAESQTIAHFMLSLGPHFSSKRRASSVMFSTAWVVITCWSIRQTSHIVICRMFSQSWPTYDDHNGIVVDMSAWLLEAVKVPKFC